MINISCNTIKYYSKLQKSTVYETIILLTLCPPSYINIWKISSREHLEYNLLRIMHAQRIVVCQYALHSHTSLVCISFTYFLYNVFIQYTCVYVVRIINIS